MCLAVSLAVGRPIHVKKNVDPPVALLEEYQKEYIEELMR